MSGVQFLCHAVSAVQLKKNKPWTSIKKNKTQQNYCLFQQLAESYIVYFVACKYEDHLENWDTANPS